MSAAVSTLSAIIPNFPQRPGIALRHKEKGLWMELGWAEYYEQILKIAAGFTALGITAQNKVAIMSNTRWEWSAVDLALMGLGVPSVPIYHTISPEEMKEILLSTTCEVLILENRTMMRLFLRFADQCPSIKNVILLEHDKEGDPPVLPEGMRLLSWLEFFSLNTNDFRESFATSCRRIKASDVITVLFTSGTTGHPKGVVLTHEAAYSEISESFTRLNVSGRDSSLSFLPYSHILGRIENWGHIFSGFVLNFAENIEKIRDNMKEVKPTILIAVPRIFEKVHSAIESQLQLSPLRRILAKHAFSTALEVGEYLQYHRVVSLGLALKFELAKKLVLDQITEAFGGRLRFAISGGAPLNPQIASFFNSCGVLILEGYGLSETTAAVTVNTPTAFQFGTVGKPIGEVKIQLAEDGEILINSKKLMREYYNDPQDTAAVLINGWFHTGDIGEWTEDGFLRITDRKKDLIKTAGGKYVAPQKLEALLKTYSPISNVLIHGDQKKFIVALITLDKEALLKWAKQTGVTYADYETLTQSPLVFELVRKALAKVNQNLASFETIKRFKILPRDFSIEEDELTPSLKVKRKQLDKKFAADLEKLYG